MPPVNSVLNRQRKPFYQTDLFKIGASVVITFLVTSLFFNQKKYIFSISHSEVISTNDMYDLFNEYNSFKPLPLMYNDPAGSQNHIYGNLHGFRYKAEDLDTILHYNKIKDNMGNSVIPDQVIFYLGQKGTWQGKGIIPSRHGNIHIIAVGIKNEQLLIPQSPAARADKKQSSIYDKADPCPGPGCPPPPPPPIP